LKKKQKGSKRNLLLYNDEINTLIDELEENPLFGTPIGNRFYKIRLSIRSKSKGKSGGARVITFVKIIAETVYLVSIYDKSEQSDITDESLKQLFKEIP
jgi:hypothetical protein